MKPKKKKLLLRLMSSFFAVMFLSLTFFGCASGGKDNDGDGSGVIADESGSVFLDGLPDNDFGGETLRFISDESRSILCNEPSGDIVNASIYKRNNNIYERFNVNVTMARMASVEEVPELVRQSVLANSDDYDVVAGYQYYSVRLATEGLLLNLNNVPNLDFSREYWSQSVIDGMSYAGATYWCTGDIALTYIGNMYVSFINKTVWENYFPDEDYYEIAFNGEWTIDKVSEMAAQVYSDINMNDEKDVDDIAGLIYCPGNHVGDALCISSDILFSKRDAEDVPYLDFDLDRVVTYCEKATELAYENPGAVKSDLSTDGTMAVFAKGNSMITFERISRSETHLRNMKDDFAILPMPKLDSEQENYVTTLHDGTTLFGIPITNTKLEATTAVLEAMAAESYRVVTPVWYDIALKIKYTRDTTSGEMIDMIRNGVTADFVFYYHVGDIMIFFRKIIDNNGGFVSLITAEENVWKADMDEVLANLKKYRK